MNRRDLFKLLGAAAAVTAAGIIVPDVARRFFLPPRAGWTLGAEPGLNVGDVLTFERVHDPLVIRRCKQFVVTSVGENGAYIDPHELVRYDATWTIKDTGEQEQHSVESEIYTDDPATLQHQDDFARSVLESTMRRRGGTPGSIHFKLELPRNIKDARFI
jgi:hypothetical protein